MKNLNINGTSYTKTQKLISMILIFFIMSSITVKVPFIDFFGKKANASGGNVTNIVSIFVDTEIYGGVKSSLEEYSKNIQSVLADTKVMIIETPSGANPFSISSINEKLYYEGNEKYNETGESKLVGTILVGNLPLPVVYEGDKSQKTIVPYVDFDDKYFVYSHKNDRFETVGSNTDKLKAEIWHGVINPAIEDKNKTINAIKDYFEKNDDFYKGKGNFKKENGFLSQNQQPDNYKPYVFYFDGLRENAATQYVNYKGYLLKRENSEDLMFNRYTKELSEKLRNSYDTEMNKDMSSALEILGSGVTNTSSSSDFGKSPDILTKDIIGNVTKDFYQIFNENLFGDYRKNVDNAGRYSSEGGKVNVDFFAQFITHMDTIADGVVKGGTVELENKIDKFIIEDSGIYRKVPILSTVTNNYTESRRTKLGNRLFGYKKFSNTYNNFIFGTRVSDNALKTAIDCNVYRGSNENGGKVVDSNRAYNMENLTNDIKDNLEEVSAGGKTKRQRAKNVTVELHLDKYAGNTPYRIVDGQAQSNWDPETMHIITHTLTGSIRTIFDNVGGKKVADTTKQAHINYCYMIDFPEIYNPDFKRLLLSGDNSNRKLRKIKAAFDSFAGRGVALKNTAESLGNYLKTTDNIPDYGFINNSRVFIDGNLISTLGSFRDIFKAGKIREDISEYVLNYKSIPSYIQHKSPTLDELKAQMTNLITPDLPVDRNRKITFIANSGKYSEVKYPYLFRVSKKAGEDWTYENVQKYLKEEIDTKSNELNIILAQNNPSNLTADQKKLYDILKDKAYSTSKIDLYKFLSNKPEVDFEISGETKKVKYLDLLAFSIYWNKLDTVSQKYKFMFERYLQNDLKNPGDGLFLPNNKKQYEIAYIGATGDSENMYVNIDPESKGENPFGDIMTNNLEIPKIKEVDLNNTQTNIKNNATCGPNTGTPLPEWMPAVKCWIDTLKPKVSKNNGGCTSMKNNVFGECTDGVDKCIEDSLKDGNIKLEIENKKLPFMKTLQVKARLEDKNKKLIIIDNQSSVKFDLIKATGVIDEKKEFTNNEKLIFDNSNIDLSGDKDISEVSKYTNFKSKLIPVKDGEAIISFDSKQLEGDFVIKATVETGTGDTYKKLESNEIIVQIRQDELRVNTFLLEKQENSANEEMFTIDDNTDSLVAGSDNFYIIDKQSIDIEENQEIKVKIYKDSTSKQKMVYSLSHVFKDGETKDIKMPLTYEVYKDGVLLHEPKEVDSKNLSGDESVYSFTTIGDYEIKITDSEGNTTKRNILVTPDKLNGIDFELSTNVSEKGLVKTSHILNLYDSFKNNTIGNPIEVEGEISGGGFKFANGTNEQKFNIVEGREIIDLISTDKIGENKIQFYQILDGKRTGITSKEFEISNVDKINVKFNIINTPKILLTDVAYYFELQDSNKVIYDKANTKANVFISKVYGKVNEPFIDIKAGKGAGKMTFGSTAGEKVEIKLSVEGIKNPIIITIDLLPEVPFKLDLKLNTQKLEASTGSNARLDVTVMDAYGNIVFNNNELKTTLEIPAKYDSIITSKDKVKVISKGKTNYDLNATEFPGLAYLKVTTNPNLSNVIVKIDENNSYTGAGAGAVSINTSYLWSKEKIKNYNSMYTVLAGASYGDVTNKDYLAGGLLFDKNNVSLAVTSLLNNPTNYNDVVSINTNGNIKNVSDKSNITQSVEFNEVELSNKGFKYSVFNKNLNTKIATVYNTFKYNDLKLGYCNEDIQKCFDKVKSSLIFQELSDKVDKITYSQRARINPRLKYFGFKTLDNKDIIKVNKDGSVFVDPNTVFTLDQTAVTGNVFNIEYKGEVVGKIGLNYVSDKVVATIYDQLINAGLGKDNLTLVKLESSQYGVRDVYLGNSTSGDKGISIYFVDPFADNKELNSFSAKTPWGFENYVNKGGIGWSEENKTLLEVSAGNTVGDSTKKYQSFSMINLGDPVFSLKKLQTKTNVEFTEKLSGPEYIAQKAKLENDVKNQKDVMSSKTKGLGEKTIEIIKAKEEILKIRTILSTLNTSIKIGTNPLKDTIIRVTDPILANKLHTKEYSTELLATIGETVKTIDPSNYSIEKLPELVLLRKISGGFNVKFNSGPIGEINFGDEPDYQQQILLLNELSNSEILNNHTFVKTVKKIYPIIEDSLIGTSRSLFGINESTLRTTTLGNTVFCPRPGYQGNCTWTLTSHKFDIVNLTKGVDYDIKTDTFIVIKQNLSGDPVELFYNSNYDVTGDKTSILNQISSTPLPNISIGQDVKDSVKKEDFEDELSTLYNSYMYLSGITRPLSISKDIINSKMTELSRLLDNPVPEAFIELTTSSSNYESLTKLEKLYEKLIEILEDENEQLDIQSDTSLDEIKLLEKQEILDHFIRTKGELKVNVEAGRDYDQTIGSLISDDEKIVMYQVFDYNNDDKNDIALLMDDGYVRLFENVGGRFEDRGNLVYMADIKTKTQMISGDFMGDDYEDIIFLNNDKKLEMLSNNGKKFKRVDLSTSSISLTSNIMHIKSFDMDNDKKMDVVTFDESGVVHIFYGRGIENKKYVFDKFLVGDGNGITLDLTPRKDGNLIYWDDLYQLKQPSELRALEKEKSDKLRARMTQGINGGTNQGTDSFDNFEKIVDSMVFKQMNFLTLQNELDSQNASTTPSFATGLEVEEPRLTTFIDSKYSTEQGVSVEKVFTDINTGTLVGGDIVNVKTIFTNNTDHDINNFVFFESVNDVFALNTNLDIKMSILDKNGNVKHAIKKSDIVMKNTTEKGYNFYVNSYYDNNKQVPLSIGKNESILFEYSLSTKKFKFGNLDVGLFEKGEVGDDLYGDIILRQKKNNCGESYVIYRSTDVRKYQAGTGDPKTKQKADIAESQDKNKNGIPDYVEDLVDSRKNIDPENTEGLAITDYSNNSLDEMIDGKISEVTNEFERGNVLNDMFKEGAKTMGKINDFSDKASRGIDKAIQGLGCGFGGGSCLKTPFNWAPLAPGGVPVVMGMPIGTPTPFQGIPVFAALTTGVPPIWPPYPTGAGGWFPPGASAGPVRIFISPTLTLGIGTAICFGPNTTGFLPPPGLSPIAPGGNCIVMAKAMNVCKGDGTDGDIGWLTTGNGNALYNGNCSESYSVPQPSQEQINQYIEFKKNNELNLPKAAQFRKDMIGVLSNPSNGKTPVTGSLPSKPLISLGGSDATLDVDSASLGGDGGVMSGKLVDIKLKVDEAFPGFLMMWIREQVAEIKNALFDLPDITIIIPDLKSMGGTMGREYDDFIKATKNLKGVRDDQKLKADKSFEDRLEKLKTEQELKCKNLDNKNPNYITLRQRCLKITSDISAINRQKAASFSENVVNIQSLYDMLSTLPLVDINTQKTTISIPWVDKSVGAKFIGNWLAAKESRKAELDRAKGQWAILCEKESGEIDPKTGKTKRELCFDFVKKIDLDMMKTINSLDKNIAVLKSYQKFPEKLNEFLMSSQKYLSQITCNLEQLTGVVTNFLEKNGQRFKAWVEFVLVVKGVLKTYNMIIDLFVDYKESCGSCKNDSGDLTGFIIKLVSAVLPGIPVIKFPRMPNIIIDLHNIKGGMNVTLPDFDFELRPITLPSMPNIYLPDVPLLSGGAGLGLGVGLTLPEIPVLPELPELPVLPDLPSFPSFELPTLPPPPKLPNIFGKIEPLIKIAKLLTKVMCIMKINPFVPEWRAGTLIAFLTQNNIDIPSLDFLFEKIEYKYLESIKVTTKVNLDFETSFIIDTFNEFSNNLNKSTSNFNQMLNVPINDIDLRPLPDYLIGELKKEIKEKTGKEVPNLDYINLNEFIRNPEEFLKKYDLDPNNDNTSYNDDKLLKGVILAMSDFNKTMIDASKAEDLEASVIKKEVYNSLLNSKVVNKQDEFFKNWQDINNYDFKAEDEHIQELKDWNNARFDRYKKMVNDQIKKNEERRIKLQNLDNLKKDSITFISAIPTSAGSQQMNPEDIKYEGIYVLQNVAHKDQIKNLQYRLFNYKDELNGDEVPQYVDFDNSGKDDIIYQAGNSVYVKNNLNSKKVEKFYETVDYYDIGNSIIEGKFYDYFYFKDSKKFIESVNGFMEENTQDSTINMIFRQPTNYNVGDFRLTFNEIVDKNYKGHLGAYEPSDSKNMIVDAYVENTEVTQGSGYKIGVGPYGYLNTISGEKGIELKTKELVNLQEKLGDEIVYIPAGRKLVSGLDGTTVYYYLDSDKENEKSTKIEPHESIIFDEGVTIKSVSNPTYRVYDESYVTLTGSVLSKYKGPLFEGTEIYTTDEYSRGIAGTISYKGKKDSLDVNFDKTRKYVIYSLGEFAEEYSVNISEQNDYYYATIQAFNDGIVGAKSNQTLSAPQIYADNIAPEIKLDTGLKAPVYSEYTRISLGDEIIEDTGMSNVTDVYIDFDLTVDADGDGVVDNDKDFSLSSDSTPGEKEVLINKDSENVTILIGKFNEILKKQIRVFVKDRNNNVGFKDVDFEIYSPTPYINASISGTGVIKGYIDQELEKMPITLFRYRGGVMSKINSGATLLTEKNGNFEHPYTNDSKNLILSKSGIGEIAKIDEQSGVITLSGGLLGQYKTDVLDINNANNKTGYPITVIQDSSNNVLYYHYYVATNAKSVKLVSDFNVDDVGVYVKQIEKSSYSNYIIPENVKFNAGALSLYKDNNRDDSFITINRDGRIDIKKNGFDIKYNTINNKVIYEIFEGNNKIAEVYIKTEPNYIIR